MTDKEKPTNDEDVRSQVRQHYGKIAEDFDPVQAASCCGPVDSSDCGCGSSATFDLDLVSKLYETKDAAELPDEVTGLSLGCGDPVTLASLKKGQAVLDLGSGGGIDCFLAAKQVGETGRVIGVDMTAAMIEKARANKAKLGAENVEFRLGEIEHLPVADETVDVVISNCVINLSPDKPQVFREAFRALRSGGRLSVSDIVTDGPLPAEVKQNMAAWAGCVSGALERDEYVAAIADAGFVDIELEPVYLDETLIDEAIEQLDLRGEFVAGNGRRAVMIEDNKARVIELDESIVGNINDYRRAVFSAKVTARKP
jgi:ubiquinone/menaquinone biosynthesis C-methylase UbiE